MTVLLAMDTSTTAVTAALVQDESVLALTTELDGRRHTEILMPLVARTFAEAGIARDAVDAIAVGVGPGPFTGLRVGIATAETLGLVLGVPAYGVCSLDAIALSVQGLDDAPQEFLVATDARRKEVYWARYRDGDRLAGPDVEAPAELPQELRALPTAGRGPVLYPDSFPDALPVLDVCAADLGRLAARRLAAGEELLPLQPLYLRQPDAVPSAGQKSALTSLAGQRRRKP